MAKVATLTVQRWGNSLAVRIPAAVARAARFSVGQPAEISGEDSNVLVRALGEPRLTLAQKLAVFDATLHGGEVIPTRPVGHEVRRTFTRWLCCLREDTTREPDL